LTPELALVATSVQAWKQNVERAEKRFFPLDDEQLGKAVAPGKNRLIYLWGHLVGVHDGMLPLLALGPRRFPELEAIFVTASDRAVEELPGAAQLKSMWDEVHAALLTGWRDWTAADWAAPHTAVSAEDFAANPLRNRLAILLSRTSHMSYHLGQAQLAPR
jgi:hypothetical protein